MKENNQEQAEKKDEENKIISESSVIDKSKDESIDEPAKPAKPAKNKENKKEKEVFLNETPRMQKFKQLNNL